jgi:hypothetical protein
VGATHAIAIVGRAVQCFGASQLRRLARQKGKEGKRPDQRGGSAAIRKSALISFFPVIPLQGPPGLAPKNGIAVRAD